MTAAEIVHQVCFAAKRIAGAGSRLTNVVFMGMGEPLENEAEVGRAIVVVNATALPAASTTEKCVVCGPS